MKVAVVCFAITLLLAQAPVGTVGFQQVTMPDPAGKPLAVGIWYPSDAAASSAPLGTFTQTVAGKGPVSGSHLPLILISHGTSGSLASHYDTALALAKAGFVVAAVTHTGDNYMDQSYAGNRKDLIDRPRQIELVLDYMLSTWAAYAQIDAGRVGMFGFSLGGFTTLVEIGGTPDLGRTAKLCASRPDAPECAFVKQRHGDQLEPPPSEPEWVHDSRIKAAVVAAPAVSFLFEGGGLKRVFVPVQLWRAENDQQAPDGWNSGVVRRELPRLPELHVVAGVGHFVFVAPCSDALAKAAPQICEDAPGFDRAAFHEKFNQAVVTFFRRQLNGSPN
jgi:predicted dienelactone hydrolase